MYLQLPTPQQGFEFFLVCVRLSNLLRLINLVRLDQRTNQIYILDGNEVEILINSTGKARIL
jgi:hypothetical protein